MGETVSNIIARVGADVSPLSASMKEAQNTILTFRDESLAALKSFGMPNISSANLVEAIQSGQRVIVDFVQDSGESLATFQERVRMTFQQAGLDISAYEAALTEANTVHASFANGAIKQFQAVADASNTYTSATMEKYTALKENLSAAFAAIGDSSVGMAGKLAAAGDIINTALPELFALGMAVMFIDKIYTWGQSVMNFAQQTQDAERQFETSMGQMSDQAEAFTKKLSDSYGVVQENLKQMMGKEYMNTRMLGFDPSQAEAMSEHITQLSYDLGKLRGVDPSTAFDALQKGIEGQTRGLMELGIRITSTDVKNEALRMGLIKQGQTMTDAATSAAAYQLILEKTGQFTDYYASQADTLSNQQEKLNKDWDEMKRNLSEALIPALTAFKEALIFVEEEFVRFGNFIAGAIRDITVFVEDVHTAISDLGAMDFSNIREQWVENYNSVFNYKDGTQEAAAAMDKATTAAKAQNAAQKALGKSLKANVMSFDQLHNISDSNGGGGGSGGAGGPSSSMPDLLPDMPNPTGSSGKNQGIVIPISFKVPPIPPIPPIPPQPPVVFPAVEHVTPLVGVILAKIGQLPKVVNVPVDLIGEAVFVAALTAIGNKIGEWKADGVKAFDTVTETISGWEASAQKAFNDVKTTIDSWLTDGVAALDTFATTLESDFQAGFTAANATIHTWEQSASSDFSTFASNAVTSMNTFSTGFQSAWNTALGAAETMVEGGAKTVENAFTSAVDGAMQSIASLAKAAGGTLSNVGSDLGNWISNNKGLLAAGAIAGVTVATGGADLAVAGLAAAADSLGGFAASIGTAALAGVSHFATGGIVTSPTLGVFGDAGPEAVMPLSKLDTMLSDAAKPNAGGSGSTQPINVTLQLDGRTLAKTLYSYSVNESDRLGRTIGYNTSYNYPK